MLKSKNQITELQELRKTILVIIEYLKSNIVSPITKDNITIEENEVLESQLNTLIGKKSNITSTITQLSNLLIKIIPLELKLSKDFNLDATQESKKLNQGDIDIINRYLNRIKNSQTHENIDVRKELDLFDYEK